MQEFESLFSDLTRQHDHTVVFNDFLDYCVDQFRMDFHQPHFQKDRYNENEQRLFYDLFQQLILSTNNELNNGKKWYDMLGLFYEDTVQSKWKAGDKSQFFTPVSVVEALAELTVPKTVDDGKVLWAYDSACGSCRTLLAYHVRRPFDVCVGGDLDRTSCLMSVINFVLHGVKGVIINTNSLSGEFFGAWRVNEFVDIGCPFTVEYLVDVNQVYHFVGLDLEESDKVEVRKDDVVPVELEDGQTTLI